MKQLPRYRLLAGLMLLLCAVAPLHAQYRGGSGDGHDQTNLAYALTAYDPADLFAGGNGDGHDQTDITYTLTAYDPADLFAGGSGDGHDQTDIAYTLTAYDPADLFAGGSGDGHDVATGVFGFVLPLTLLTFEAAPDGKVVLLRWTTTEEYATSHFTVERGRGTGTLTDLGEVTAAGNSAPGQSVDYAYTDAAPLNGRSYYRLRMVDLDGTFTYSELRAVDLLSTTEWDYTLAPNPNSGDEVRLRTTGELPTGAATVELLGSGGRSLLRRRHDFAAAPSLRLALSRTGLAAGVYVIRVVDGAAGVRSKLLVVQ